MQGEKRIEHFIIADGRWGPVDYPFSRWPLVNQVSGYPLDHLNRVVYELRDITFHKIICGDPSHLDIVNYLVCRGLDIQYVTRDVQEFFGSINDAPKHYRKTGKFFSGKDDLYIKERALVTKPAIKEFVESLNDTTLIIGWLPAMYALGYQKDLEVDSDWKVFRVYVTDSDWLIEEYRSPCSVISTSQVTMLNRCRA